MQQLVHKPSRAELGGGSCQVVEAAPHLRVRERMSTGTDSHSGADSGGTQ